MSVNEYLKRFYPVNWQDNAAYEFSSMLGGMRRLNGANNIFPSITCDDGTCLSVQGHFGAYSRPRDDFADEYRSLEVGYITDAHGKPLAPPETWRELADGEFPSDIYGYVTVDLIEEFIASHGGIKP